VVAVVVAGCYRSVPIAPVTTPPPTCALDDAESFRQQFRAVWAQWQHGDELPLTITFNNHVPRNAHDEQLAVRQRRARDAASARAATCLSTVMASEPTISATEAFEFLQHVGGLVYARDLLRLMLPTYDSLGRDDDAIAVRAVLAASR
jgi:hypothetical protein